MEQRGAKGFRFRDTSPSPGAAICRLTASGDVTGTLEFQQPHGKMERRMQAAVNINEIRAVMKSWLSQCLVHLNPSSFSDTQHIDILSN